MLETLLDTLEIMSWLGLILFILASVNIVSSSLYNVWSGKESFSWSKLLKGIWKVIIFFISAVFVSIAFTILPFINEMITTTFGMILISNEVLTTLSGVGVLGVVISTIVVQGKKAGKSIVQLANVSSDTEVISWNVEDE